MTTFNHLLTDHRGYGTCLSTVKRIGAVASRLSETLWLCLTFLLFLATGPFSIFAVIFGLYSLASRAGREHMEEPAHC